MAVGAAPVRGCPMRAGEPPIGMWECQHVNVLWAGDSGGEGGKGRELGGQLIWRHARRSCFLSPRLKS